ncbi:MAG TPA: hypothetical protein VNZ47_00565 [Candidatus Dormibacteraeota bacterium]|jgi:hypothetical protein|nr:hypothetical protein [Candidatus Dormibacteraeota bacterium]
MSKSTNALLASAALMGLLSGVGNGAQSPTPTPTPPPDNTVDNQHTIKMRKEKHACKGQNSCKGKGGCGSTKGKNDCKGKGECRSDGKPMEKEGDKK